MFLTSSFAILDPEGMVRRSDVESSSVEAVSTSMLQGKLAFKVTQGTCLPCPYFPRGASRI